MPLVPPTVKALDRLCCANMAGLADARGPAEKWMQGLLEAKVDVVGASIRSAGALTEARPARGLSIQLRLVRALVLPSCCCHTSCGT